MTTAARGPTFAQARALAETVLAEHRPEHWRRTQAAAREAIRLAELPGVDREPLIAAAVLHDVGRSPVVARTGVPPLDAARFLRTRGHDRRVRALVAHQLAAAVGDEDDEQPGLGDLTDEASPTRDALWWCLLVADAAAAPVVAGPDGRADTDGRRRDATRAAVARTRARLDAAGLPPAPPPA